MTAARYNAAFLTLQFLQNFLNSAKRQLIAQEVAFLLSLNPWKVQESKYTYTQLQSFRLLQEVPEMADPLFKQSEHNRLLRRPA